LGAGVPVEWGSRYGVGGSHSTPLDDFRGLAFFSIHLRNTVAIRRHGGQHTASCDDIDGRLGARAPGKDRRVLITLLQSNSASCKRRQKPTHVCRSSCGRLWRLHESSADWSRETLFSTELLNCA
jgi:hypothetical protein